MVQKFYVCPICGNIIAYAKCSGVDVMCCGQPMEELIPNTVEATKEKHIPVVKKEGDKVTVKVGSAEHPMSSEHQIEWIFLQTNNVCQRKKLKAGDKPEACFKICDKDEIIAVMAYCNLHGLWKGNLL